MLLSVDGPDIDDDVGSKLFLFISYYFGLIRWPHALEVAFPNYEYLHFKYHRAIGVSKTLAVNCVQVAYECVESNRTHASGSTQTW